MPTDKVLFQCREELFSVGIQLHRLFQQIVQVDTLSGAYEECRAELNAVPELLQHILELLQAHIVNVDCHSKELMSVLLCVCLAVKGQRWNKPEAVSYDLIEHIQTVINDPLLRPAFPRRSYLGGNDIPFPVMLPALQAPLWEYGTVELFRLKLPVPSLVHQLSLITVCLFHSETVL